MKTTTFAPMKIGKNQKLLPSGVKVSADGKYHYWQCSVSGLETFAKPDYWVKIMAKFKTEDNLVKTYVCRKAQQLLEDGKTPAEIIVILTQPESSAAKKEKKANKVIKAERKALTKKVRTKGLKSFAIGSVEVAVTEDTGSIKVEKQPVYPWQGDPSYFGRGGTTPTSVSDSTKDTCAMPNRYLDDECRNCPLYDQCTFERKFTADDWKKGKKAAAEVKVKEIKSFE